MGANIPFNYLPTTVAAGTFNVQSTGWVQGAFVPDPAIRFQLAGGVLAATETIPMWGGVAIREFIPLEPGVLGGSITRASSLATLTGFSVFDQAYAMAITPNSQVPLAPSGGQVNFFRMGSNARIVVKASALLAGIEGVDPITQQVSWDFVAQELVPFVAAYPANVFTAASWASTSGGQITFTTTSAHGVGVGAVIESSGNTPAGYNGTFVTLAGTTGSTIVVGAAVNPGANTVLGTLVAGGGALPCKVLEIATGNSITVSYDPAAGTANWNYSDTVAVIQI